jgi:hypothetical protein
MEPALARPRHEAIDDDDLLVHEWRVRQLTRLGIPWSVAQAAADHVDWHQVAKLVRPGRGLVGDVKSCYSHEEYVNGKYTFHRCRY